MCDQLPETLDHIILGCIFSREVWAACLRTFIVGWNLWKERNARTFDRSSRQPAVVLQDILDEASLWMAAGFRSLRAIVAYGQ